MPLLSAADHPQIRAAIDIDLDAEDVPDEIIALDIYRGAGERAVAALAGGDPAGLTGDDLARAREGAILFTAALLVEGLPTVMEERIGNYSYRKRAESTDPAAVAPRLRERARAALAVLLPTTTRRRFGDRFAVARAGR